MGYCYLLIEREFVKTKENIYTIGRTRRMIEQRFEEYPKGSKLIEHKEVSDCVVAEAALIKHFDKMFIKRRDIGNEYYEGDINLITKEFLNICKLHYCEPKIKPVVVKSKYYCEYCKYNTKHAKDFRRHCNTTIHSDKVGDYDRKQLKKNKKKKKIIQMDSEKY